VTGPFSVGGDVLDQASQFAGGALGMVGVPVGDGGVDPRLAAGDGVVGEVVGPPGDGVGELGRSPSGAPHGGGCALPSRLAVDLTEPADEPLSVLVEQDALFVVGVWGDVVELV